MIIVTGGAGFIGTNLVQSLLNINKKVLIVEELDKYTTKFENIKNLDILDCIDHNIFLKNLDNDKYINKIECIFHLGACSKTTEPDRDYIMDVNLEYSKKLLMHAANNNIDIIYASSASVYGDSNGVEMNPLNYYAISKVQVDYWVLDNIDRFKSVQGFRYFNVYGDGEENKGDQASPVSKFTKQIKETGKLKLFEGSDKFLRDFICVDDIVNIVLDNKKPSGIYDLGTSSPVSFQHVAECIAKKYNGEIEYIQFPKHLKGKYQDFTCAMPEWGDYSFMSIEDYLE